MRNVRFTSIRDVALSGPKANGLVSLHSSLPTSRSLLVARGELVTKGICFGEHRRAKLPPALLILVTAHTSIIERDKWGWLAKPVSPRRSGFDPRLYGRTACPGITTRRSTTRCGP